jgi:MerR HTH family regulatory protein
MPLDQTYNEMIECARKRSADFPLIAIKAIAAEYGLSVRTLRRWQAAGLMPAQIRHGRRKMYRRDEVTLLFSERTGGKNP